MSQDWTEAGSNLPYFRSVQLDFAAHIRHPQKYDRPADIEPRRMQIYIDLFFNNIQGFLAGAFPLCKQIISEAPWLALVREFVHLHPSESPYFLQISQEFLTFLHDRGLDGLPDYLLELAHYEWVELSLDVAADVVPAAYSADAELSGELVLNPYLRALTYTWPVQQIGPDHQPDGPPPKAPTFLIVYRNTHNAVRFIESNPVTHRLLALLEEMTTAAALEQIAAELQSAGRQVSLAQVQEQGMQTLSQLQAQGIILGVRQA
ncbi:MAG: putative DNA-binding domain-containing protein [Pseudomonadota bacterium]